MDDENTIEFIEKSKEIVQKIEWDRKYGEKLKDVRNKIRRPNINISEFQ